MHNAQSIGSTWIESNCNVLISNQHRVLLGWAYVLSQQFLLNYAYLSKQIHDKMESDGTAPSFSIDDLLRQIGLDDRVPELRSTCQEYSMLSEKITDVDMNICDRVISLNTMKTCLIQRPQRNACGFWRRNSSAGD